MKRTCLTFKTLWGMSESMEQQLSRIAAAGFDGVEGDPPAEEEAQTFRRLLKKYHLAYIADLHTAGDDHFLSFAEQAERALTFDPVLINSQTGKDWMPWPETIDLFARILDYEKTIRIPVCHETHRSRPTFSPMSTLTLCRQFPDLRLSADFSHWCCVCESLLEDQQETLAEIIPHVVHIHGRVGYPQGPQAPDPRAPEYRDALAAHERWWAEIAANRPPETPVTFAPEYGPAFSSYLHTLPYTDMPVADTWAISLWAKDRFLAQIGG